MFSIVFNQHSQFTKLRHSEAIETKASESCECENRKAVQALQPVRDVCATKPSYCSALRFFGVFFASLLLARTDYLSITDKWFCPWGNKTPYSRPKQGQTSHCVHPLVPKVLLQWSCHLEGKVCKR